MKKLYASVIIILLFTLSSTAQGIYQLWGATPYGGSHDEGVLFSTRHDGSGYHVKKHFTVQNPGQAEHYNKPVAFNNKLYSILSYGGLGSDGIIAEYDPATGDWTKKADLYSIGAAHSAGSLIVYNNKLYGVAYNGGTNGVGVIFEFNPANNGLVKLYDMVNISYGSLTLYNNRFYGITASGGVNGDGVIYEFNPATNTYTEKADFNEATTGNIQQGSLTLYNGKFWGTATYGGLNDKGTLFSYDPVANVLSKKGDFANTNLYEPVGGVTVFNNKLYGGAFRGGASQFFGGIFEFNPANNALTNIHNFTLNQGHFQMEFTVLNNKLYTVSSAGGYFNEGQFFSYDPVTKVFDNVFDMSNDTGEAGGGALTLFNGKLYGFTTRGGYHNQGAFLIYDPAINTYLTVRLGGNDLQMPEGPLLQLNNKIYGTTSFGGQGNAGGIYEYDITTGTYTVKVNMQNENGKTSLQGGFILHNNKFYGVTRFGGSNQVGALYEYDPATNIYTKKHDFAEATGSWPYGQLAEYNGKLYGMCASGSGNNMGNIYEYNPATNTYAQRVILDAAKGGYSRSKLTWYNNRFYGVCYGAGANGKGTIFEYNPAINSFVKKYDFDGLNGAHPEGGLTLYNSKFYGLTFNGGLADSGTIYEYNPATVSLTKKVDLNMATGYWPHNGLTLVNNKLCGMLTLGGANDEGTIFQFDPVTGLYTKKIDFTIPNGRRAISNELIAVPALVAPGSPNSCINTQTININAANANEWIAYTDAEGRAVAEINANGNILGNTAVRFYVNGGDIRLDGNSTFYLDRNITITSTNTPTTPVSVRLYVRKREVDDLKQTAGSGVIGPASLAIFKNDDFCEGTVEETTEKLASSYELWGNDYVYTTEVTSFSSFYFASNNNNVLPVHILSFKGSSLTASNKLEWKASCSNSVSFTVERSADGTNFKSIGDVKATKQDCNHPFAFDDASITQQPYYYRLQMKENNGVAVYSQVVVLSRGKQQNLQVKVWPNPVQGNVANLSIVTGKQQTLDLSIIDISGRVLMRKQVKVSEGNTIENLDVSLLNSGVYHLQYYDGEKMNTMKFIKQ